MAIAPFAPLIGYGMSIRSAGGFDLWRTDDGGTTWTAGTTLPWNTGNNQIDVNPLDALDVVIASHDLYRSTDGLATVNMVLGSSSQLSFARSPSNPSVLYVSGLPDGSLRKSADLGATWSVVFPSVAIGNRICVDAVDPQRLYASQQFGRLRSDDGGKTFSAIGPAGYANNQLALSCHPTHADVLLAGSFKSSDAGATWTTWFDETAPGGSAFIVPGLPNVMFHSASVTVVGVP